LRHPLALPRLQRVVQHHFPAIKDACRDVDTPRTVSSLRAQRVSLTSPRLRRQKSLRVMDDDITVARPEMNGSLHVLRAANILNDDYFSLDALRQMVMNLRSRLRHGGLFVVCTTTDDTVNHATVFRLQDNGRLTAEGRLNGGALIESL